MPDIDHMRMAQDIFREAVKKHCGLVVTDEAFHKSSPSTALTSEEEGKYFGQVAILTEAVMIQAKVWIEEHGLLIHASAYIVKHYDRRQQRDLPHLNAWAYRWYSADEYQPRVSDN